MHVHAIDHDVCTLTLILLCLNQYVDVYIYLIVIVIVIKHQWIMLQSNSSCDRSHIKQR